MNTAPIPSGRCSACTIAHSVAACSIGIAAEPPHSSAARPGERNVVRNERSWQANPARPRADHRRAVGTSRASRTAVSTTATTTARVAATAAGPGRREVSTGRNPPASSAASTATWVVIPAVASSPTAVSDSGTERPLRCRKRIFTAPTPKPAGRTWFATLPATWAASSGRTGSARETAPCWQAAPANQVSCATTAAPTSHTGCAPVSASTPSQTVDQDRTSHSAVSSGAATASTGRTSRSHPDADRGDADRGDADRGDADRGDAEPGQPAAATPAVRAGAGSGAVTMTRSEGTRVGWGLIVLLSSRHAHPMRAAPFAPYQAGSGPSGLVTPGPGRWPSAAWARLDPVRHERLGLLAGQVAAVIGRIAGEQVGESPAQTVPAPG
ncbi:exported hypothetical protein [Frankia sp. AgKG'84/4]